MMTRALVTGAIAVLVGIAAAPAALADPPGFSDITCSCQPPPPQAGSSVQDHIKQGIRQGLSDLNADPGQR
jgi:hypothetical protein